MPQKSDARPKIVALTRRRFIALAAAAGGAVLASEIAAAHAGPGAVGDEAVGRRRITLPEEPNQNPAFMARAVGDGGLLLWSQSAGGAFRGFRLNASGRTLYRLCDGSRDSGAIGAEYARRSGRPAAQGVAFVERLREIGVVVSGATVGAAREFPTPPPGGCYHRRIEPDDPVS